MSEQTRAYMVVLDTLHAMKGYRIDRKWQVAACVVGALVAAGLIPHPDAHESPDRESS